MTNPATACEAKAARILALSVQPRTSSEQPHLGEPLEAFH